MNPLSRMPFDLKVPARAKQMDAPSHRDCAQKSIPSNTS